MKSIRIRVNPQIKNRKNKITDFWSKKAYYLIDKDMKIKSVMLHFWSFAHCVNLGSQNPPKTVEKKKKKKR